MACFLSKICKSMQFSWLLVTIYKFLDNYPTLFKLINEHDKIRWILHIQRDIENFKSEIFPLQTDLTCCVWSKIWPEAKATSFTTALTDIVFTWSLKNRKICIFKNLLKIQRYFDTICKIVLISETKLTFFIQRNIYLAK